MRMHRAYHHLRSVHTYHSVLPPDRVSVEWWVAVASETSADAFLATQGYVWDTQSDMWLALLGAIFALLSLSRLHDRQLKRFMAKAD